MWDVNSDGIQIKVNLQMTGKGPLKFELNINLSVHKSSQKNFAGSLFNA